MTASASDKAAVLVEALPYIRRFAGQVVVVKYGGNALAGASEDHALSLFAEDIVLMRQVGMRPVVVHGGGPQISDLMGRLGKVAEFRNGWSGLGAKLQTMRALWPENPLIVSELWSGWFDNWGAAAHNGKTPAALDRALHELAACGASGARPDDRGCRPTPTPTSIAIGRRRRRGRRSF